MQLGQVVADSDLLVGDGVKQFCTDRWQLTIESFIGPVIVEGSAQHSCVCSI